MHEIISKISWRKTIVLAIITICLLLVIFKIFNFHIQDLGNIDKLFLFFAVIVTLPFPLLSALRWWYILRAFQIDMSYKRILKLTLGAWPLSIFPGRAGDFARVVGLPSEVPMDLALTSVFLEKVKDILILVTFSILGTTLSGLYIYTLSLVLGALFLLAIVYLLPNLNPKIKAIRVGITYLLQAKRYLFLGLSASALNWFLSLVQVYFLFAGVGVLVPFVQIMTWLPLAIFVGILPITLEGMGTRDGALIYFFSTLASTSQIITVGIWYSLLGYWFLAILGLPWLRSLFVKSRH